MTKHVADDPASGSLAEIALYPSMLDLPTARWRARGVVCESGLVLENELAVWVAHKPPRGVIDIKVNGTRVHCCPVKDVAIWGGIRAEGTIRLKKIFQPKANQQLTEVPLHRVD